MNLGTFLIVTFVSITIAFSWQLVVHVWPAYKNAKIAESLAVLAKCIKTLDQDALLNSRLTNGGYLHDKLYKSISCILTYKTNLKFSMLGHVKYTEKSEEERDKFRLEIESLDTETKDVIDDAIFAMGTILFLREPLIFLLVLTKVRQKKKAYQSNKLKQLMKDRMFTSAEYITINAKSDDYSFVPC